VFTLFVKNLDFSTNEETLRTVFGKCGEILNIRLPTFSDSGKRRGYGFIDFKEESALKRALKLNRIEVNGRQLLLERSNSQTKRNENQNQN
jgi:nucleolin